MVGWPEKVRDDQNDLDRFDKVAGGEFAVIPGRPSAGALRTVAVMSRSAEDARELAQSAIRKHRTARAIIHRGQRSNIETAQSPPSECHRMKTRRGGGPQRTLADDAGPVLDHHGAAPSPPDGDSGQALPYPVSGFDADTTEAKAELHGSEEPSKRAAAAHRSRVALHCRGKRGEDQTSDKQRMDAKGRSKTDRSIDGD